jgi:carbon storage regulator CsrA
MLVLSRKIGEDIVFPTLGVRVRVVQSRGRSVRIGIDAPEHVRICREELPAQDSHPPVESAHRLRNRLQRQTLTLHLIQKQLQNGQQAEAEKLLEKLLDPMDQADDSPRRRVRALVVDDDTNERELLAGLLGMNGCDCATATDGVDALEYLAANEQPDVVLLDMMMPRCDGVETLARIRQDPRHANLAIFAISGADPRALGVSAGPGGVDAWFQKPLDPRSLWRAIESRSCQN